MHIIVESLYYCYIAMYIYLWIVLQVIIIYLDLAFN